MKLARSGGILLHPTSLPGPYGIGDLGPQAYRFADFLASARMKIWQVLPLGPTGYGDSPYQSFSAFAGNPLLLSPEMLVSDGLLPESDLAAPPELPADRVDFARVTRWKRSLLDKAFARFTPSKAFQSFCETQGPWLDDFARFMAFKEANGHVAWTQWNSGIEPKTEVVEFHRFLQFKFFEQWFSLHRYCRSKNIRVMGDIPIYVAHDSADVWANRSLFDLGPDGSPRYVAGVPPDYFSATGQLWGNPIYRWDVMKDSGFAWWIERFRATFQMVDIVRLDHFRGFEAYWRVPASAPNAIDGKWIKAPGFEFLTAVREALGGLPLLAEDLGHITPEVEALRDQFGLPGMKVLQFAFGRDSGSELYLPYMHPNNSVVYTGTHDNDTTQGWFHAPLGATTQSREQIMAERDFALRFTGAREDEIHWGLIRAAMGSPADTVLVPLQDVLGSGGEARMNTPGNPDGNWVWRFRERELRPEIADRLADMTDLFGRRRGSPGTYHFRTPRKDGV